MSKKSMYLSLNLSPGDVREYYRGRHDYYTYKAAETKDPKSKSRFQKRAEESYMMFNGGAFWDIILEDELNNLRLPPLSRVARIMAG